MKFLKEGFDVFVLASFEDKSSCRILHLLEFVKKMFLENLIEENYSSQVVIKLFPQIRITIARAESHNQRSTSCESSRVRTSGESLCQSVASLL